MFPTLIVYLGYQNQLHHERLARCPLSHEWAVRVADEGHLTPENKRYMLYQLYIQVYVLYIHGIYMVYTDVR